MMAFFKLRKGLSSESVERGGFTLIEVMVALVLLSLMSVIILESYRAGLGVWESRHRDMAVLDTARAVMQKIKLQVKSSYPYEFRKRGSMRTYFKGEENSIQFASMVGLSSQRNNSLVHILRYVFEEDGESGGRLRIEEYSWPRRDFPDGEEPIVGETIEGVLDFKLRYEVEEKANQDAGPGIESEENKGKKIVSSWDGERKRGKKETLTGVSVSLKMRTGKDSVEEFNALIPVMKDM